MARTMHFEDRMSANDAVILDVESDPQLRSTITAVWLLDRAPDPERFARKIEACSREIPRLRQRAVSDPLGLAPPRWEVDPYFDLDFHVRRLAAPGEGTFRDLLEIAQPIAMQAFDFDRPLWELYVVEGLAGGRAGLLMKLHHAVSDGVGLVRMTKGMIERTRDEDSAQEEAVAPEVKGETTQTSDLERTLSAAAHRARTRIDGAARLGRALGAGFSRLLRDPSGVASDVVETAASVGRMLAPVTEPLSPVMRGRSLSVHFDALVVPLEDLKRAAKAAGGTVNDAFVGAVAGGLRRYHEHMGEPVEGLRMNMPINVRSGEKAQNAGNQFAPARFVVPVGIADPAERMQRIHEIVAAQRAEPALPLLEEISAVLGALPGNATARLAGSMMKAVDFTTSNVPGPRFPVYASGAKIEGMFGFGPLAGAAANITCFSYDGNVHISVNVDTAAVSDPAVFVECLRKGLDEVLAVV